MAVPPSAPFARCGERLAGGLGLGAVTPVLPGLRPGGCCVGRVLAPNRNQTATVFKHLLWRSVLLQKAATFLQTMMQKQHAVSQTQAETFCLCNSYWKIDISPHPSPPLLRDSYKGAEKSSPGLIWIFVTLITRLYHILGPFLDLGNKFKKIEKIAMCHVSVSKAEIE